MAAAVKDHSLGAADPVGELLRDAGRPDRILVAGDDQGRAVDEPVVGAFGLRLRLAGAGKSLRILAHMALAHKRDRNGIVVCHGARHGRLRQLVRDRAHPLVASDRGALAQPFARRILRLKDRPK